MAHSNSSYKLKFELWNSCVKEEFWHRLAAIKLDALHLDDKPLEIQGYFAPSLHERFVQLQFDSFLLDSKKQTVPDLDQNNLKQCRLPGTLYNTNTKEEFLRLDQRTFMNKEVEKLRNDIFSGRAIQDCTLLNRFFLVSYADLKKWQFHYWFAFPALVLQPLPTCSGLQPASQSFNEKEAAAVLMACQNWRGSSQFRNQPFFLLQINGDIVMARPLSDWADCQGGKVIVAFYDPSQARKYPGWPLRNLLTLAAVQWHTQTLQVLCYREKKGQADLEQSLFGDITIPEYPAIESHLHVQDATGWEYNIHKKPGPKMVDLATSMDPTMLAQSAADLNLKLMRWRLLPSLDIDLLSNTKCLLLGAGTLGCQVARGLMAWGIRRITFVDCGHVAMSNPVRQSLYGFHDCLNGGKPKAEAAADSLRHILPGVEATGVRLTIPMPGHSVSESELTDVMRSCSQLHDLVDEHDVVFLLTDTRESRWLPTLLCASANKVAINAALGFDTYLVMRHGAGPSVHGLSSANKDQPAKSASRGLEEPRLGCYFCNDVVAPEDSTTNRTLDQQCTVTRPGVAPIAAAQAVELAVSLLHHPSRIHAPADNKSSPIVEPLGILPHQIRGFAANFSQLLITGAAFSKCTACSLHVVAEYQRSGFDFLMQVFNHPTYLEDLTGLTDLISATKNISIEWEEDSEESS